MREVGRGNWMGQVQLREEVVRDRDRLDAQVLQLVDRNHITLQSVGREGELVESAQLMLQGFHFRLCSGGVIDDERNGTRVEKTENVYPSQWPAYSAMNCRESNLR